MPCDPRRVPSCGTIQWFTSIYILLYIYINFLNFSKVFKRKTWKSARIEVDLLVYTTVLRCQMLQAHQLHLRGALSRAIGRAAPRTTISSGLSSRLGRCSTSATNSCRWRRRTAPGADTGIRATATATSDTCIGLEINRRGLFGAH